MVEHSWQLRAASLRPWMTDPAVVTSEPKLALAARTISRTQQQSRGISCTSVSVHLVRVLRQPCQANSHLGVHVSRRQRETVGTQTDRSLPPPLKSAVRRQINRNRYNLSLMRAVSCHGSDGVCMHWAGSLHSETLSPSLRPLTSRTAVQPFWNGPKVSRRGISNGCAAFSSCRLHCTS